MTLTLIIIFLILNLNFLFFYLLNRLEPTIINIIKFYSRQHIYKHYDVILSQLNNAKEVAYNKIHRERLMTHFSSGYRLKSEELAKYQEEYIKTVFELCGNGILADLIELFGDKTLVSIIKNLSYGFTTKVLEDEITITNTVKENSFIENEELIKQSENFLKKVLSKDDEIDEILDI